MNLSNNGKLVLLIFILAIVGIVFLEYTREHLDFSSIGAVANAALNEAGKQLQDVTQNKK